MGHGWQAIYGSCHVALVESPDSCKVEYGVLLSSQLFHKNPMYMRVQAVFDSIWGPHHRDEDDGWSKRTEAAICLLFGIAPTDTQGFFTAAGTDYLVAD